ncbi:hypothetical protein DYB37_005524 [Aphanomyces astaci]|uniref:U6 snRNA-associated Sm-like protein LSm4 n=1 Tax=Aphanomyces astaci TaxID=112090 RepID=A0A3R7AS11_APHAT|nr:hypothetical protein DYB35_000772 [Aphanomyces astaci]RHZ15367.1 hypothetical protein DYB37_005524 [Aphanomyces astaci]
MNINLKEVICTAKDGDRFWKLPECYIRGNTIKYIRIPDEILDMVVEEDLTKKGKHRMCIRTTHAAASVAEATAEVAVEVKAAAAVAKVAGVAVKVVVEDEVKAAVVEGTAAAADAAKVVAEVDVMEAVAAVGGAPAVDAGIKATRHKQKR